MNVCLIDPEDVLEPLDCPLLDALRARIFRAGISQEDFEYLLRTEEHGFQQVFGESVLLKVEFDVAFIGEHSHLVYVPERGNPPQAITAFPHDGALRVEGPVSWKNSIHAPNVRTRTRQRVGLIATEFDDADWRRVAVVAQAIDEAELNYNFLFQNSNSVVATLAVAGRLGFVDLPGGGLNLGARNLLFDELMGGSQVPSFLIRGGMSQSGPLQTPVPHRFANAANTDG